MGSMLRSYSLALLTLLVLSSAAEAAERPRLVPEIEAALKRAYSENRQPPPKADALLTQAALALAQAGLASGIEQATSTELLARELDKAGGWDPPPRAVVVRARPVARVASALSSREDLASTPATHYGLGIASDGENGCAVLLLSRRRAVLDPFPRRVEPGSTAVLSGKVVFPLERPKVFVTGPQGRTESIRAQAGSRDGFAADVTFPVRGRYTLEVVAESVAGPEVVALFRVQAGEPLPASAAQEAEAAERTDLKKAENQVFSAINRRRLAQGARPLARSSLLDTVAAEHAAEMVRLGYFAHVSPVSGDVGDRLTRAGFAFRRVGENLGEAATALDAHRLIEASPGHLANVVDPEVQLAGLGTARVRRGSIENVVLVEVFALPR